MNKVAKFEKVSFEQFKKDWVNLYGSTYSEKYNTVDDFIKEVYDNIKLPKRGTKGSAGYDIFLPIYLNLPANEAKTIPTGIRCKIAEGWVLKIYPRSGQGFKYGIHLSNSVGIIDSDYFFADNEGHIMAKIVNDACFATDVKLDIGQAFCQGIFVPYGITEDDEVTEVRTGGLGSTDKGR